MQCFHPWVAYQPLAGGPISMVERHDMRQLTLPCGRCVGCKLRRARSWAIRCMHESQLHPQSIFVTLTYDDEHLPLDQSLNYKHFQDFMKRLRWHFKVPGIRFYMCGEYGEETSRPHYHAILFGVVFNDNDYWSTTNGFRQYRSKTLDKLWSHGQCMIGSVTLESAGYCARYIMKKFTGDGSKYHDQIVDLDSGEVRFRVKPFNRMSLKPGVGHNWLMKYLGDVFPHGKVVANGVEVSAPRYYEKMFEKLDFDAYESLQFKKDAFGRSRFEDNSDARLLVKEAVQKAAISTLNRGM